MSKEAKEVVVVEEEVIEEEEVKEEVGEVTEEEKSTKTFTQEQVNRMMAAEKRQGKNSALRELGIDPKDKKAIGLIASIVKASATEEEEADGQVSKEVEDRLFIAETKAEVMQAGIKSQYVDDIVILLKHQVESIEGSDLKTLISDMKKKYPEWFEGVDGGADGTGSAVDVTTRKEASGKGIGSRLAAKKKAPENKTSFWD